MHKEVLTKSQVKLFSLLGEFSDQFGLVGGTAIALHIGHRRSVDFDLFTQDEFESAGVRKIVRQNYTIEKTLIESRDELTLLVEGVKMTFYRYSFEISYPRTLEDIIGVASLKCLAAMKAFTLGKRAKWKDYVDLYFVFERYQMGEIIKQAERIFGEEFNEKLFREQLAYFKDIDYSEEIEYLKGFEVDDEKIRDRLKEVSLAE